MKSWMGELKADVQVMAMMPKWDYLEEAIRDKILRQVIKIPNVAGN